MSFHGLKDSTNSVKAPKGDSDLRKKLQSHQVQPTMLQ